MEKSRSSQVSCRKTSLTSACNRVNILVGGSRGIGLALVEAMAGLGSDVAILDIMEPQVDIEKLQSQYSTHIKHFKSVATDIISLATE